MFLQCSIFLLQKRYFIFSMIRAETSIPENSPDSVSNDDRLHELPHGGFNIADGVITGTGPIQISLPIGRTESEDSGMLSTILQNKKLKKALQYITMVLLLINATVLAILDFIGVNHSVCPSTNTTN